MLVLRLKECKINADASFFIMTCYGAKKIPRNFRICLQRQYGKMKIK